MTEAKGDLSDLETVILELQTTEKALVQLALVVDQHHPYHTLLFFLAHHLRNIVRNFDDWHTAAWEASKEKNGPKLVG